MCRGGGRERRKEKKTGAPTARRGEERSSDGLGRSGPGRLAPVVPSRGLWVSRQLPGAEAGAREEPGAGGRAGRGGGRSAALLLLHCSLLPSPPSVHLSLPPRLARCTMAAPSPGPGSGSGPGSQAAQTTVSSMQGKGARLGSGPGAPPPRATIQRLYRPRFHHPRRPSPWTRSLACSPACLPACLPVGTGGSARAG